MSTPTGPAGGGDADGTHQPPGWPDFLQAAWNETWETYIYIYNYIYIIIYKDIYIETIQNISCQRWLVNIFDLSKHSTTTGTCCILIHFAILHNLLWPSWTLSNRSRCHWCWFRGSIHRSARSESRGSEDMVQRGGLFDDERCLGCYVQWGKTVKIIWDHLGYDDLRWLNTTERLFEMTFVSFVSFFRVKTWRPASDSTRLAFDVGSAVAEQAMAFVFHPNRWKRIWQILTGPTSNTSEDCYWTPPNFGHQTVQLGF